MGTALGIAVHRHWRSLTPEARFPFRFVALLAALAYLMLGSVADLGDTMVGVTIGAVEWTGDTLRLAVSRGSDGTMFFGDGAFAYRIVPACTTAVPGVLYAAAVLAYPAPLRDRLVGLGLGLPALFVFNIARLVVLAWVGLEAPQAFDTLHWYGFQVLLIFMTGVLFVAWAQWTARTRGDGSRGARQGGSRLRSVAIFIMIFSVLTALGMSDAVVSRYSRLVSGPYLLFGSLLWPDVELMSVFRWRHALVFWITQGTFVALVLATRSHEPRARIRKALLGMVPLLVMLQSVDLLFQAGQDISETSHGYWSTQSVSAQEASWIARRVVLLTLIPLAYWWAWARREPHRAAQAMSMNSSGGEPAGDQHTADQGGMR